MRASFVRLLYPRSRARLFTSVCSKEESLSSGWRYRLVQRLGTSGSVFLAKDVELARTVVLKLASRGSERLFREARLLATLTHPNVVPVLDVGTMGDGRAYVAMPHVHGRPFDAWVARNP